MDLQSEALEEEGKEHKRKTEKNVLLIGRSGLANAVDGVPSRYGGIYDP